MKQLRREEADAPARGRPWKLPLEDRLLLVAAYWRTNLTLRQLAPLFGVSKFSADRVIDHLGPKLALRQRERFAKDAVLIVDGTLVPTRDHTEAEQSKNHRYSTNHQVVIDATAGSSSWSAGLFPATAMTAKHGRNPAPGTRLVPPRRSPTAAIRVQAR